MEASRDTIGLRRGASRGRMRRMIADCCDQRVSSGGRPVPALELLNCRFQRLDGVKVWFFAYQAIAHRRYELGCVTPDALSLIHI